MGSHFHNYNRVSIMVDYNGVTFLVELSTRKGAYIFGISGIRTFCPGAPLTYFNDGGVRVIFLGLKFWPKVIFFGSMKDSGIFGESRKKTEGFFGVAKKELRDFLGCAKKVVTFSGRQILKL